jgi:cell surface protein SprA
MLKGTQVDDVSLELLERVRAFREERIARGAMLAEDAIDDALLPPIKLLSELNFFYLPQSWAFNTNMHRTFTHLKMRDFNTADLGGVSNSSMDWTFSKDFTWDRNFDFKYDLTKNLKFSFQTAMNSTVDEGYYTPEIIKSRIEDYEFANMQYEAWKDTIQRSMATWGTPYTYQQLFSASWNVPFNRIPYIEAITANASYNATYNWNRTMQTSNMESTLGNIISSTRSWQVDGGINFETLYNKSNYWKQMTQHYNQRSIRRRTFRAKKYTEVVTLAAGEAKEITHRLGSDMLKVTATTADG